MLAAALHSMHALVRDGLAVWHYCREGKDSPISEGVTKKQLVSVHNRRGVKNHLSTRIC